MTTNSESPPIRSFFAKRLKALRVPRGYPTARSFAAALEIDENRYTRYERAEVEPDLSLIVRICTLLSVSPNDLLEFAETPSWGPGFAEPATTAPTAEAPAPPRRALAWQLAEELAGLDAAPDANALDRFARTTRLFAEIDADTFTFVTHMIADPRFAVFDTSTAARIGALAAKLMATLNAEILGPAARG